MLSKSSFGRTISRGIEIKYLLHRLSQHDDDDNECDDGGDHNDNPFLLSVIERLLSIQFRLWIHQVIKPFEIATTKSVKKLH